MPYIACTICSKEFYIKPSHQRKGWGKYCSVSCRSKSQFKGRLVSCFICGKKVYRSPKALAHSKSNKYFCTKSCQTLWRNQEYVNEKNYNWKNGEHAYRNILKRAGKNPICFICKITDERVLVAHHKNHVRTDNQASNLVWLCRNCHYLVHQDKQLDKIVMEALV